MFFKLYKSFFHIEAQECVVKCTLNCQIKPICRDPCSVRHSYTIIMFYGPTVEPIRTRLLNGTDGADTHKHANIPSGWCALARTHTHTGSY